LPANINTTDATTGSALIAMSGGVDSAVAALLLKDSGVDVAGAVMRLFPGAVGVEHDARAVAEQLGIQLHVYDYSGFFSERVIKPFITAYHEGRTPNPCIDCNKHLKFGCLLDAAGELGMKYLATGHYAQTERSEDGRFLLKKGADKTKDQSYVLYTLTQEQLAHIIFPLGRLTKAEVRERAEKEGLLNAKTSESQDICFVPEGNYVKFIEEYTGKTGQKGRFVDTRENDLGENRGVINYTIGQRRGLGLAMECPYYVVDIRPEDNTVVVGREEMLYSPTLIMKEINLIPYDRLDMPIRADVRIRYKHKEQPAVVRQIDEDTLRVDFDEPQRAITRGQSAVIYIGDVVIGGGVINEIRN